MKAHKQPRLPLLETFEQASRGTLRAWMLVILAFAGLWVAIDWAIRFAKFRWQDSLVSHASAVNLAPAEFPNFNVIAPRTWRTSEIHAKSGGSLSAMLPLPWVRKRFEEHHAPVTWHLLPDGYVYGTSRKRAETMADTFHFDAVLVGDSCWVSAGTQIVAEAMADLTGKSILNRGQPAAGPFLALRHWGEQAVNAGLSADVLIWDLSARELGAGLFSRQDVCGWFATGEKATSAIDAGTDSAKAVAPRTIVHWDEFAPRRLDQSLPSTSVTAFFSRKAWAILRLVMGAWPEDVRGGTDPVFGPVLYYRYNLEQLESQTIEKDAPAIVHKVIETRDALAKRGTQLLVVLVPEKEQIVDGGLSPEERDKLASSRELLVALEEQLEANGVPTVNLLGAFRERTARGEHLFWRDDTHWNDAGMRLAAHLIAQKLGWQEVEP